MAILIPKEVSLAFSLYSAADENALVLQLQNKSQVHPSSFFILGMAGPNMLVAVGMFHTPSKSLLQVASFRHHSEYSLLRVRL